MDSLTFGAPILLRNFNLKDKIIEIDKQMILDELNMTSDQYIDLSILCGCDYSDSIKGIGPTTAFNLIKNCGNIEGVLKYIENNKKYKEKFTYDSNNFDFNKIRKLFKKPNVKKSTEIQLNWTKPDYNKLKDFLCYHKRFANKRIEKALNRLSNILL